MLRALNIGSKSHFVAVRTSTGEVTIKEFYSFTSDFYELPKHLKENKVTTIAMESTGVYVRHRHVVSKPP